MGKLDLESLVAEKSEGTKGVEASEQTKRGSGPNSDARAVEVHKSGAAKNSEK